MKKTYVLFLLVVCLFADMKSQTNLICTNPVAEQILLGNYNPADYTATVVLDDPDMIAADLQLSINPDSLKSYIVHLSHFGTRNSGSDTLSNVSGYGAARRWVYGRFNEFSAQQEQRLVVSYLQFDMDICGMGQHRNVFAVLPGTDPTNHGIVIIEGHMDSRCAVLCDTSCLAEGVEDNASGTALVMELARVMAPYSFKNTLVFLITTAEEQGLLGAEAFAAYVQEKQIPLRAVLNNDVIGGVICGQTSSSPSCPGVNDVDSTGVRLFSFGSSNSKHKQLARFIKLEYQENILPTAVVPMAVRIMSPEDRSGRGGDHIPFREHNYPAMRFTAANEHGDASNGPNYTDRQHTSADVLGVDTDGDGAVDSFFVQFNYLARNAVINGNAAAMIARNVPTPQTFTAQRSGPQVQVTITDTLDVAAYRVAIRGLSNDWDSVYTLTNILNGTFACAAVGPVYVSVAGVDDWGIESLFSAEKPAITSATETVSEHKSNFELYQNRPNPFDEATWISFWAHKVPRHQSAMVQISDTQGRVLAQLPLELKEGLNEILYTHGYGVRGAFIYSLVIDGLVVGSKPMIFAN